MGRNEKKKRNRRVASKSLTRRVLIAAAALATVFVAVLIWKPWRASVIRQFRTKESLLYAQAVTEQTIAELGDAPAGAAGHAVFFSVCDGASRARVFSGVGTDLGSAWKAARAETENALRRSGLKPRWVKVDVVYRAEPISAQALAVEVDETRNNYYRYGLAFDEDFSFALIEQEMSGSRGYDYEGGGINVANLNVYLREAGRPEVSYLPDEYIRFQCYGWFCDDDGTVYPLADTGRKYGRREVELIDKDYAAWVLTSASAYLKDQVKDDGSFVYVVYPRINKIDNYYNIIRHAGAIWGISQSYRVTGDKSYLAAAENAIGYMQTKTVYASPDTCYLYGAESDDYQLGGNALAILALTEYMDVSNNDDYIEFCRAFGNGILSMMNAETGEFIHSLNPDFSLKDAFTIIYYDGEAAFALSRMYTLTGEQKWLDAAQRAIDRFIAEDYTQYCDHWIAYALNEITKYVTNRPDYYEFALRNVQVNMDEIETLKTPAPTYWEMLLATFELYDRMVDQGLDTGDFDSVRFLRLIYGRADAQLNGYFFPEYAMYMAKPDSILYAFTSRWDDYRTRIDDVQHNMGGYYLYWKNYDKLITYEGSINGDG